MQPLNDDMDELFRRASEEYPLNTGGADWNKVLQELHHDERDLAEKDQKKRDYKFLWLLLLLPVGFICGRYVGNNKKPADVEASKEIKITSAPALKTTISKKGQGKSIVGENAGKRRTTTETDQGDGINDITVKSVGNKDKFTVSSKANSRITGLTRSQSQPVLSLDKAGKFRKATNGGKSNSLANKLTKESDEMKAGQDLPVDKTPSPTTDKISPDSKQVPLQTQTATNADSSAKSNNNNDQMTKVTNNKESKNKKQGTFKRGFSYSLMIGPDVSAVKSKKTSDVGYSLGLMLKYRITKKVSVEAGALWDRKNYYTEGKYLDTNMLKLPMHSIVKNASGYCNMIEIPVNIRYDFITKQNHSWFVSGGLSSYLMQKEDYNISYERYNQPYEKDYGYMNSTKDWFSIMNLSVGYQKSLGKYTNINIAPYVKLPLRGIGIGKIPVSSGGLYLSLSRSFK